MMHQVRILVEALPRLPIELVSIIATFRAVAQSRSITQRDFRNASTLIQKPVDSRVQSTSTRFQTNRSGQTRTRSLGSRPPFQKEPLTRSFFQLPLSHLVQG